jgi:uncharacterized membrane protein
MQRSLNRSPDLALAVATAVMALVGVALSIGPLRVAAGLPLILFFPGYVLLANLYPQRDALGIVYYLALSVGLSLALVPLGGLALNLTPWGIHTGTIMGLLVLWTLALAVLAHLRRRGEADEHAAGLAASLAAFRYWAATPSNRPQAVVLLTIGIVVLVVTGVIGYRSSAPPASAGSFTELALLSRDGRLDGLQRGLQLGESTTVTVTVTSREREETAYRMEARLADGSPIVLAKKALPPGDSWSQDVTVTPTEVGERQQLQVLLYREQDVEPYRSVHLWLDVSPVTEASGL